MEIFPDRWVLDVPVGIVPALGIFSFGAPFLVDS
jgi:hypothetical protein